MGDAFTRGISGGEKRRVTIGEMLAGTKNVLLMDKISNGLDTCTTNQIMSSIRDVCRGDDAKLKFLFTSYLFSYFGCT